VLVVDEPLAHGFVVKDAHGVVVVDAPAPAPGVPVLGDREGGVGIAVDERAAEDGVVAGAVGVGGAMDESGGAVGIRGASPVEAVPLGAVSSGMVSSGIARSNAAGLLAASVAEAASEP
jgi:hypothetical protein